MKYKLASNSWDKSEYSAMKSVIKSGYFTMGKHTSEFEKNFGLFHGKKFAVMVNSGSSANLLMVAAKFFSSSNNLTQGDEVIVPAVSWSTTFFPLQQYGLKVVFVDIDPDTFNISPQQVESAITDKTKAIMAVNLLGNPCNYDEILNICAKYNLILFEDNCGGLGAKYKERYCGSFGNLSSFSFFFSHHISTMEGGMILTDDEELYQIMVSLRAHGWTRHLPKKNLLTHGKSSDSFNELINFVLPGYNLRPLELSAAIGNEQLKKVPKIIKERRKNADFFKKIISKISSIKIQTEIEDSSWFSFGVICEGDRKKLIDKLIEAEIEFRPIAAGNFTKNPAMQYFNYRCHGDLKNSNLINDKGLFFGNSHKKLKNEINLLYKTLA